MSARIRVGDFDPSRGQRRILKRNAHLERSSTSPWATDAQYDLFRRYLDARHAAGGMADMDISEFGAMIEETPVRSRVVEYWRATPEGNALAAVCLTDLLSDGVSMVYSFFDPDLSTDSLGTFIILDHVAIAREAGLPYVYLGYWVPGSAKMDYKSRFSPLEVFTQGQWRDLCDVDIRQAARLVSERAAVVDQVAAIELPSTG